jgi:predicted amidohydrolase YtcJ
VRKVSVTQSTLLSARRVLTGTGSPANAILICDGRIAAVGEVDDLRRQAPSAAHLDLAGTTLTPGLVDAHVHLTEWALGRHQVDLADTASPEEAVRATAVFPHPGSGWIRGRGWSAHAWHGRAPDRELLDESFPNRPAALQSHDMHSLWVNSAALGVAGITRDTPDPRGGAIVRDERGEPTGLLLENAAQLVSERIPPPTAAEAIAAITAGQAELHRLGFTGVHSFPPIHITGPDTLSVLQQMHEHHSLKLRILQHFALESLETMIDAGIRSGFGGERIRIGGVKLFLDGALGSRTAWMRHPYENSASTGVIVMDRDALRSVVTRASAAGIACTVHAIGDAAVELAVQELRPADRRVAAMPHRIEHVQCCPPELFGEFAAAGIVASVQPCHLMSDWEAADRHWGARARNTYAFRSLLAAGATLAFGSDAPVEPIDPRRGLFAAVARRDGSHRPDGGWYAAECITAADALRGFTRGPAIAAGTDDVQGTIRPGAWADITAWTEDPLEVEPERLPDIRCAATIVGGAVVHS